MSCSLMAQTAGFAGKRGSVAAGVAKNDIKTPSGAETRKAFSIERTRQALAPSAQIHFLNKSDAIDFMQRRNAGKNLLQGGFAQAG